MKIKVWDLPTRFFHWFLVSAYIAAFYTSHNESLLEYHIAAGYIALGLVFFRVLWGFAGGRHARFSDFVRGWAEVKSFMSRVLRLDFPRFMGHNPAVGWVIIFILCVTFILTATGIITYGGEENRGVWVGAFTFAAAVWARDIHEILSYFIVAVVVIHICAALVHDFILKENIILSMITGFKEDPESWGDRFSHLRPEDGHSRAKLIAYVIAAVIGGFALIYLPPEGKSDPAFIQEPNIINAKGFAVRLKTDKVWKDECAASCHSAFHPTLLSAGSWRRVMAGLDDHFGETIMLEPGVKDGIEDFLTGASAERSTTEASKKLLYSIDANAPPPMRVTEVPYWRHKHDGISEDIFKRKSVVSRSNCPACHPWAESGSFEDKDIQIPE
ncbi:MAG: cytochrome b/b6 domain-containing protein [Deltaproteobacteria bacterium]|nr:cytochrome b/b6 domain-containing protein [Deltaproteobacteria bacterium]